MQGIEVPIKDVGLDLDFSRSEAHNCRYMPEERSQKPGAINNYRLPQTIHRHPR
jgi:hypothetical protein